MRYCPLGQGHPHKYKDLVTNYHNEGLFLARAKTKTPLCKQVALNRLANWKSIFSM